MCDGGWVEIGSMPAVIERGMFLRINENCTTLEIVIGYKRCGYHVVSFQNLWFSTRASVDDRLIVR